MNELKQAYQEFNNQYDKTLKSSEERNEKVKKLLGDLETLCGDPLHQKDEWGNCVNCLVIKGRFGD